MRPDGCCDKHDDSAACVQAGWRRIKLEEESFYNVKYQQFECLVAAVAAFVATPYPFVRPSLCSTPQSRSATASSMHAVARTHTSGVKLCSVITNVLKQQ